MELRINIKLRLKLSKTATVTKEILKQVYGEKELSRSRILNGLAFFWDGQDSVEDDVHYERPRSVSMRETAGKVRELVPMN